MYQIYQLNKIKNLRVLLVGFLLMLGSNSLLADGSRDLYPAGATGYRAFLRSSLTVDAERWPFPTRGTHYVYAKAGERIAVASSAQSANANSAIRLYAPNGNAVIDDNTIAGQIPNRTAELSGPKLTAAATDGGYVPLYHTVVTEGIYRVELAARGNGDPTTTISASGDWVQSETSGIAAWDISVINTLQTAFIKGRVYTNILNLSNGTASPQSNGFQGIVYALTKDGFVYKINNNGSNGIYFSFFVNNNGFTGTNGFPIYKSLNRNVTSSDVHNPKLADTREQVTHKMFYTYPAADLPETSIGAVPAVAGSSTPPSTWLKVPQLVPTVTNVTVRGVEGVSGQISQKGGYVLFNANRAGKYTITIKSTNTTPAIERVLTGFSDQGANEIFWDGKGSNGSYFPAGTDNATIAVQLTGAEVHFPFIDMEYNINGIIIQRLVDGSATAVASSNVFWDDTDIPTTSNGSPSNPKNNSQLSTPPSPGINSEENGHKWGAGGTGTSGQFGDVKGMDTWTFVAGPVTTQNTIITTKIADLAVTSLNSDKSALLPGEEVKLTVKVKNSGPSEANGAKFQFTIPAGFTPVGTGFAGNTCGTETTAITYDASTRTYNSVMNLPNGCEITYTITLIATSSVTTGNQTFVAGVVRPNDVTDPDATNNTPSVPPTSAQYECTNNGQGGNCNNIKNIQLSFSPTAVCTEPVQPQSFSSTGATVTTRTVPATDYGFVMDIFTLDNSFTLKINGVSVTTQEIQFTKNFTPAQNIRFVNGPMYYETSANQSDVISNIWTIIGTPAAPAVRLVVSANGVVTMYGSKTSGGALEPLELFNGNTFNNVIWNSTGTNEIEITQIQTGPTNIAGAIRGVKITTCPCFNPATTTGTALDTPVGITLLQRAGAENAQNWPVARKGGHLALESNTKGFVITRIAKANLPNIQFPQEGMMVYDTTDKCLKLYSDGVWACFSQPACP